MLCALTVENYALISKLEIEFKKGLTIITGETGAGKSILLGALSLILGKRADTSVLLDKARKCIVEGTFDISDYNLSGFFSEKGIDYDNQSVLRREVSAIGKSRAFINDMPVNLEVLGELGTKLIDIHSQHQNLNLSDSLFQMKVIDSFAMNQELLKKYHSCYSTLKELQYRNKQLTDEAERSRADLDYLRFQYSQLEEARLTEGEQEVLEFELEKLTHAEEIKVALSNAMSLLQGDQSSILQQLKDSLAVISRISKFLHGNENMPQRIESAYIEMKEVTREIESLNNQLYYDAERLAQINDRLNQLYNLEKKHRVSKISDLISLRDQLKDKIESIDGYDFHLEELEKQVAEMRIVLEEYATELSSRRQNVVGSVEKQVTKMLDEVGMPNGIFNILIEKNETYFHNGSDQVQFLFTANKNTLPQDISKVASGGEMSRLMLCVKSLLSDSASLPTIVFDEIDSGVSGEIAERVGNIMNRMAERMQIINITHLPQIASKGKYHYLVYKDDEAESTVTRMKLLNPGERQLEIAKMLSGEEITSAAMDNARTLLGN